MNQHANALLAMSRAHPRVGLGQLNILPPELVQGVKELIVLNTDSAKQQILAEVKQQGHEAKMYALLGGTAAGLAGVGIGVLIGRTLRR